MHHIQEEIDNSKMEKEIAAGTYGVPQPPDKRPKPKRDINKSPFVSSKLSYLQALVSNRE